ncbi:MAG: hypothetical protein MK095_06510, partial [Phycisphaerales bacterium]|nr:hypothetical protein [Phycisphaerales bacterium]
SIGEELFAASAYLSNDPEQLGSLKGQDVGKVIAALLLVIGCLLATMTTVAPSGIWTESYSYVVDNILGDDGLVPEAWQGMDPESNESGEEGSGS